MLDSTSPRFIFDNRALDEAGFWTRETRVQKISDEEFPPPDFYVGKGPRPRPYWTLETITTYVQRMRATGEYNHPRDHSPPETSPQSPPGKKSC